MNKSRMYASSLEYAQKSLLTINPFTLLSDSGNRGGGGGYGGDRGGDRGYNRGGGGYDRDRGYDRRDDR